MGKKLIGAKVPDDLHKRLLAHAKAEDVTLAQIVRRLLRQYAAENVQEAKPAKKT